MCFNGKWKADENAWIAADLSSKTKEMCVVSNKTIDISRLEEAAFESHLIGKKHKSLVEINRSSPPVSLQPVAKLMKHLPQNCILNKAFPRSNNKQIHRYLILNDPPHSKVAA